MINRIWLIGLQLVLLCLIWSACNRVADPCLLPTLIGVNIGIYKPADTGINGVDSTLPKGVLGYAENGILQYNAVKSSKFSMRLSSLKDTTIWFITPDSTAAHTDTITMIYTRQVNFISTSCGYAYHYYLQNVLWTNNSIDSIKVNNNIVEGDAKVENVKIFY